MHFLENGTQVGFDGSFRNAAFFGDLLVGRTIGGQYRHLYFPWAQPQLPCSRREDYSRFGIVCGFNEALKEVGPDPDLASVDDLQNVF